MSGSKMWLAVLSISVVSLLSCGGPSRTQTGETVAPKIHPEEWPELTSPIGPDADLEARVGEILAVMSVEAKVGQIIQAEINSITPEEVKKYRIGSVLNGGGGWPWRKRARPSPTG